jgi:hypothetical protein
MPCYCEYAVHSEAAIAEYNRRLWEDREELKEQAVAAGMTEEDAVESLAMLLRDWLRMTTEGCHARARHYC